MLIRAIFATNHGLSPMPEFSLIALEAAKTAFDVYTDHLWQACEGHYAEPHEIAQEARDGSFASYLARCSTVMELLSLKALRNLPGPLPNLVSKYVSGFVKGNI